MSEHTHVPKCFGFAFGVIFSFSSLKMASGIHHIYVQLQCKIIYVKFEIKVGLWQYSNNFAMPFPFLFPVIPGNNNVSFPFPKFGNGNSTPVPGPKNWEWNFHSRSHSQSLGMSWVITVPVPKCPKVIPHSRSPLHNLLSIPERKISSATDVTTEQPLIIQAMESLFLFSECCSNSVYS